MTGSRGGEAVKRRLRRWQRLYAVLQRGWYTLLYRGERHLLGSRLHELRWKLRDRRVDDLACPDGHPHRDVLLDRLERFAPYATVLEVGCGVGHNLVTIARRRAGVRLRAVDVNPRVVAAARRALISEGVEPSGIRVGRADDLSDLEGAAVDVALTDATLMYVGPDRIEAALRELIRVSRKGIVLNEWQTTAPPGGPTSTYHYAHWVHDYPALLSGIPRVASVTVERLPDGLWDDDNWGTYGALVSVELHDGH